MNDNSHLTSTGRSKRPGSQHYHYDLLLLRPFFASAFGVRSRISITLSKPIAILPRPPSPPLNRSVTAVDDINRNALENRVGRIRYRFIVNVVDKDQVLISIVVGVVDGTMRFPNEELLEESNNLGALYIEAVRGLGANCGGGGGGGKLGFARGETEAGIGLFPATGGLVEDRSINFGDENVVVVVGLGG